MVSGTSTLDAAAVLAAAREFRREANAAEAGVLAKALEWAHLHEVDDLEDAATWMAGRGQDTGIPLAGEGAPLISEFAVCELATALGLSAGSGRNLVAQALELPTGSQSSGRGCSPGRWRPGGPGGSPRKPTA